MIRSFIIGSTSTFSLAKLMAPRLCLRTMEGQCRTNRTPFVADQVRNMRTRRPAWLASSRMRFSASGSGSDPTDGVPEAGLKNLDEILASEPAFLEWFVQVHVPNVVTETESGAVDPDEALGPLVAGDPENETEEEAELAAKQFVTIGYRKWIELGRPSPPPPK